jgi:hypothetical protein
MPRAARPRPLCWLAIAFCQQPEFLAFCRARDESEAKAFILRTCDVASRKELDTNPDAAARFHAYVRKPYAYGQAAA